MKKYIYLLLLVSASASGQPTGAMPPTVRLLPPARQPAAPGAAAQELTQFDLDFPGGNPKQLVAAIEKATGRPLNVVIPDEYAGESIPALKMTQVTVPDLFRAMQSASLKNEAYRTGGNYGGGYGGPAFSYQQIQTEISFQTSGPITDDSIWYFRGRQKAPDFSAWDVKPAPAKICRFYSLNPYLDQGIKVEDITTAIQTGWKMLGEKETPSISFHKETKLLIAVGEPQKLETIDAVLTALRPDLQTGPRAGVKFSERLSSLSRTGHATSVPAPAKTNAAAPESEN